MATEAVIFQQIVDMNWDQAIYTASPNDTINVAQFAAKGSGTNIGIALTPKGTGYISAQVPDGTVAGGNARGAGAVDLQTARAVATQVASGEGAGIVGGSSGLAGGQHSFVGGGLSNVASGVRSAVIGGQANNASGTSAVIAGGFGNSAGGNSAFACGDQSSAGANRSAAIGYICYSSAAAAFSSGSYGFSYLRAMRAHGQTAIGFVGGCQEIALPLFASTVTNAEVIMSLDLSTKPILRANTSWTGILHLVGSKSDGSAFARYHRQVTIRRTANTTQLVGSAEVVGADVAAGTSISITASDTDEALSVGVTGIAGETWRWSGAFHGAELQFAS